jgi:hypothetical protein
MIMADASFFNDVRTIAVSGDGRCRVLARFAFIAPTYFYNWVELDGVVIEGSKFTTRSAPVLTAKFNAETKTWAGVCWRSTNSGRYQSEWMVNIETHQIAFRALDAEPGCPDEHHPAAP